MHSESKRKKLNVKEMKVQRVIYWKSLGEKSIVCKKYKKKVIGCKRSTKHL